MLIHACLFKTYIVQELVQHCHIATEIVTEQLKARVNVVLESLEYWQYLH